jgi:hypothetical protein
MEQGMEGQLKESTDEHRQHRHRRHRHNSSRRKRREKIALRLGVMGFILLVIAAVVYVCTAQ